MAKEDKYERTTVSIPMGVAKEIESIVVREKKMFPNVSQYVCHIIRNAIEKLKGENIQEVINKLERKIEEISKKNAVLEYKLEEAGIEIP